MGRQSIVQPIEHGEPILLYNPCTMGFIYHCTTHNAWGAHTLALLYNVVWPMGHGKKVTEGAHSGAYVSEAAMS